MATTCATCLTAGRRTLAALLRSRGISELSVRCWGRCLSTNVTAGEMTLGFSTGKYARLADGAVMAESGGTSVLVTAVSKTDPLSNTSWVPLQVDYRERAAAASRIPHNFLRRELRSTDREVIISRFIDRSLRPLFPEGYAYDTQIICNVLAADGLTDPEVLGVNGAAAALMLSDIPWAGPIAAVRVAMLDDQLVVNPSTKALSKSSMNLIVTCTSDKIVMVEGLACEIPEEQFCEAVLLGMKSAQELLQVIGSLRQDSRPVRSSSLIVPSDFLSDTVAQFCREKIMNIYHNTDHKKISRDQELFALVDQVTDHIKRTGLCDTETGSAPSTFLIQQAFWNTCKLCMQSLVLDEQKRVDGRAAEDLRPIECEVDMFDSLHGSALFRRGETQVLCTVTFDSLSSAAKADAISTYISGQVMRNFMIHYDFPPFATNTTGHFLLSGRREIGHGALAEKALQPVLPEGFPFTIRVSSQVTDSNGSSSMATVCGSSLALFDAGVQMRKPVAGVACGLVLETGFQSSEWHRYQILNDLAGIEDAVGNMDFKMAGTRDGITSCQLDLKGCHGIPFKVFEEAVMRSRDARSAVLDKMDECQSSPRPTLKKNSPATETVVVPGFRRFKLFGSGGYKIRKITEETGVEVDTIDDMHINVYASSLAALDDFKEKIDNILNSQTTNELEPGAIYNAMIVEVQENGLFLEMVPGGVIAFLPSSHIQSKFLGHPGSLGYGPGQHIAVKYFGRDPVTGQLQVSKKALTIPSLVSMREDQLEEGHTHEVERSTAQTSPPHTSGVRTGPSVSRRKQRRRWWDEEEEFVNVPTRKRHL